MDSSRPEPAGLMKFSVSSAKNGWICLFIKYIYKTFGSILTTNSDSRFFLVTPVLKYDHNCYKI